MKDTNNLSLKQREQITGYLRSQTKKECKCKQCECEPCECDKRENSITLTEI